MDRDTWTDPVVLAVIASVRLGGPVRTVVVVWPAYIAGTDGPELPEDLLDHRSLVYRYMSSGQIHCWPFERDGREVALATPRSAA
ncbi:hypothetical protein [uncultured Sphingomonas sp.]|uniref:hypothetical protein n=1 Tax=uncultured Sphingomonas sp. TaxID=158754 RepID=UPI0035CC1F0E